MLFLGAVVLWLAQDVATLIFGNYFGVISLGYQLSSPTPQVSSYLELAWAVICLWHQQ